MTALGGPDPADDFVRAQLPDLLLDRPGRPAQTAGHLRDPRERPARADRVSEERAVYTISGDPVLDLAIELDAEVRRVKPDDFRGHQARENTIKAAMLPLLKNDVDEVERIFLIIKAQREY